MIRRSFCCFANFCSANLAGPVAKNDLRALAEKRAMSQPGMYLRCCFPATVPAMPCDHISGFPSAFAMLIVCTRNAGQPFSLTPYAPRRKFSDITGDAGGLTAHEKGQAQGLKNVCRQARRTVCVLTLNKLAISRRGRFSSSLMRMTSAF